MFVMVVKQVLLELEPTLSRIDTSVINVQVSRINVADFDWNRRASGSPLLNEVIS